MKKKKSFHTIRLFCLFCLYCFESLMSAIFRYFHVLFIYFYFFISFHLKLYLFLIESPASLSMAIICSNQQWTKKKYSTNLLLLLLLNITTNKVTIFANQWFTFSRHALNYQKKRCAHITISQKKKSETINK